MLGTNNMIEISGIDHIVIGTANTRAMLEFYCSVLGCTVERETPDETGLTQLRAGNALIDIVAVDSSLGKMGGGAPTKTENNLDHYCLQLKPISESEIKTHLLEHGFNDISFQRRYGAQGYGQSVYINDPDGNTVELRSQI